MTYPPQQPGPYGPGPQGWPPGGKPPKSNTGLIVAIVVAAFLLAAGAVTVALLLTSDGETGTAVGSTPASGGATTPRPTSKNQTSAKNPDNGGVQAVRTVATAYVDAVARKDAAKATALGCKKAGPGVVYENAAGEYTMDILEVEMLPDGRAQVIMRRSDDPNATKLPITFDYQNGAWCIAV